MGEQSSEQYSYPSYWKVEPENSNHRKTEVLLEFTIEDVPTENPPHVLELKNPDLAGFEYLVQNQPDLAIGTQLCYFFPYICASCMQSTYDWPTFQDHFWQIHQQKVKFRCCETEFEFDAVVIHINEHIHQFNKEYRPHHHS